MERVINNSTYTDYPEKYAKKIDWWISEEGLGLIRGWRSQGKTIKEVITMMGIDPRTFRSWRKKHREFDEVMTVGAEIANANVTLSLYKRALGYEYTEQVYELIEGEMRLVREFRKHMPPDTKAILAWLYNRMPEAWRSIQEPLENTQYKEVVKDILVTMRDVANGAGPQQIEVKDDFS